MRKLTALTVVVGLSAAGHAVTAEAFAGPRHAPSPHAPIAHAPIANAAKAHSPAMSEAGTHHTPTGHALQAVNNKIATAGEDAGRFEAGPSLTGSLVALNTAAENFKADLNVNAVFHEVVATAVQVSGTRLGISTGMASDSAPVTLDRITGVDAYGAAESFYSPGLAIALGSVMKFKQHKDNPTQTPIGTPVALVFVEAALLFLPSIRATEEATVSATAEATDVPGVMISEL